MTKGNTSQVFFRHRKLQMANNSGLPVAKA